jgi:hypothetical protein
MITDTTGFLALELWKTAKKYQSSSPYIIIIVMKITDADGNLPPLLS